MKTFQVVLFIFIATSMNLYAQNKDRVRFIFPLYSNNTVDLGTDGFKKIKSSFEYALTVHYIDRSGIGGGLSQSSYKEEYESDQTSTCCTINQTSVYDITFIDFLLVFGKELDYVIGFGKAIGGKSSTKVTVDYIDSNTGTDGSYLVENTEDIDGTAFFAHIAWMLDQEWEIVANYRVNSLSYPINTGGQLITGQSSFIHKVHSQSLSIGAGYVF